MLTKSIAVITACLLTISAPLFAQTGLPTYLLHEQKVSTEVVADCGHSHALVEFPASAIERRPYDVLSYDLTMDWRDVLTHEGAEGPDRRYRGINIIRVKIDSANTSRLVFNANQMAFDSVLVNGVLVAKPTASDGEFAVELTSIPTVGEVLTVSIYYQYRGNENRGFHLYPKGTFSSIFGEDTLYIPHRVAYTMSEPQNARYWMPCNDRPYDKAVARITVLVPDSFVVSSNGDLIKNDRVFDVEKFSFYRRFEYFDTTQVATYLMVANASKFASYGEEFVSPSEPDKIVPVTYFYWQEDDEVANPDNKYFKARYSFSRMVEMMQVFSEKLGRYPFNSYGMTAVEPFNFGGMEHQTMSTIHRNWLRGFSESGIAHELGHMWGGDLITCATWGDIWLNEGFATYSEYLWAEHWGGQPAYTDAYLARRRGYMERATEQPPIYGIPLSNIFNYGTTYAKGSTVHHMLRRMIGDSVYFSLMKQYFARFAYQSIETKDFVDFCMQMVPNSPVPMDVFFDQWVYKPGHPIYRCEVSTTTNLNGTYRAVITLTQEQTVPAGVPEVFIMPVKIYLRAADSAGTPTIVNVFNDKRVQQFEVYTNHPVFQARVDEDNSVLCERLDAITSVSEPNSASTEFTVSPNPVVAGSNLTASINNPQWGAVTFEVFDVLGRRVMQHNTGTQPPGIVSITLPISSGLAPGAYTAAAYVNGIPVAQSNIIVGR